MAEAAGEAGADIVGGEELFQEVLAWCLNPSTLT